MWSRDLPAFSLLETNQTSKWPTSPPWMGTARRSVNGLCKGLHTTVWPGRMSQRRRQLSNSWFDGVTCLCYLHGGCLVSHHSLPMWHSVHLPCTVNACDRNHTLLLPIAIEPTARKEVNVFHSHGIYEAATSSLIHKWMLNPKWFLRSIWHRL